MEEDDEVRSNADGSDDGSSLAAVSHERDHKLLFNRLALFSAISISVLAVVIIIGVLIHAPGYALLAAGVAAVAAPLGAFVTVSRDELSKLGVSTSALKLTVSIASVLALVAGVVIVVSYFARTEFMPFASPGLTSAPTAPSETTSSSPTSSGITTTPSTSPSRAAGSLTRDGHCAPPNPSDWKIPNYDICVVAWCQGIVVFPNGTVDESRIQVKVRPRITNNAEEPLDVTIWKTSALRLLVRSSDLPDSWRPPRETAKLDDRPYIVEAEGQKYWAVAPNIPNDVDLPDDMTHASEIGFATFWSASEIAPDSAYPPLDQVDEHGNLDQDGDLVFQLPARTPSNNAEFLGLALMKRSEPTEVLDVAWFEDWGPRTEPTAF